MAPDLKDRVAARLDELGLKPIPTAVAAGLGRDFIADILNGKKRSVRGDKLQQLATALQLPTRELLGVTDGSRTLNVKSVPLTGYVGAGDAAHFYSEEQGDLDRVDTDDPDAISAREIRGRSMGRMLEGWLVFTAEPQRSVPDVYLGRICEVRLADGRILVKQVRKAKLPGLFHLYSETEEPMLDEEVEWSAVVTSMRPR